MGLELETSRKKIEFFLIKIDEIQILCKSKLNALSFRCESKLTCVCLRTQP